MKKRVLVVGAGLVGMCTALRLAQAGVQVVLADQAKPATGASWAAAGMLAPAYEAAHEPEAHADLFELCMAGADIWRDFAPWLQAYSDTSLDYFGMGTLACAVNAEQVIRLDRLEEACREREVPVRRLTGKRARAIDASLSSALESALLLPTDQQIDNWAAIGALMSALAKAGVQLLPDTPVKHLHRYENGWRVRGVGDFDRIVWTAGVGTKESVYVDGELTQLVDEGCIIPVKGQMLAVDPILGAPEKVLRFGAGYIAPKSTRIVIGATSEWGVSDKIVQDSDILALKNAAAEICPILAEADVKMSWAGVRPGTIDHAPIIGWSKVEGIAVAAGHYRNGILLSPLTADIIVKLLLEQELSTLEQKFSLGRFQRSVPAESTSEKVLP
ncbi:NAD(P)/FAD-dependent oxidoreductase [Hirschia litorea]|uniref:NAD(P)/FAD-dependent oxidoreductase n=1 Tax=Hirschia litorea TaxID=1199156 RepID=A0ABW2IFX1_9PROT